MNNSTGATVLRPRAEPPGPFPLPQARRGANTTTTIHDPVVYLDAARRLLPRWLGILGSTPWFEDDARRPFAFIRCASDLYRRQAATLAVALICELDERRADQAYLVECVRASLIRWQLTLRGDGRPAHRGARRSPLHGAVLYHILQLLGETTGFQTEVLLSDIERHARWLARRGPHAPWLEADTICALADGAMLVRDADLLGRARKRLAALLTRQDEEGWFPERGGPDIGRLSLALDALAHLYRQNAWEELKDPLRRMLRFLIHFVHPDGTVGGCYGSCNTAFISPFGVELLAPSFSEAAGLALLCRRRCAESSWDRLYASSDSACAVLGASLILAAANAALIPLEDCTFPHERTGLTRFPRAGLSIFSSPTYHAVIAGRKGGAVRVTWRNGSLPLDDYGVTVVSRRGTWTGTRFDQHACESFSTNREGADRLSVTCSGVLRRSGTAGSRRQRRFTGMIRRMGRMFRFRRRRSEEPVESSSSLRTAGETAAGPLAETPGHHDQSEAPCHGAPSRRINRRGITHDYYSRRITFGEDWVEIRDRVRCRLPCQAVVCQSAPPGCVDFFGGPLTDGLYVRPPQFVDGGRNVEITRIYRNGRLVSPGQMPDIERHHRQPSAPSLRLPVEQTGGL